MEILKLVSGGRIQVTFMPFAIVRQVYNPVILPRRPFSPKDPQTRFEESLDVPFRKPQSLLWHRLH